MTSFSAPPRYRGPARPGEWRSATLCRVRTRHLHKLVNWLREGFKVSTDWLTGLWYGSVEENSKVRYAGPKSNANFKQKFLLFFIFPVQFRNGVLSVTHQRMIMNIITLRGAMLDITTLFLIFLGTLRISTKIMLKTQHVLNQIMKEPCTDFQFQVFQVCTYYLV